jgi:hypothetical protein
MDTSSLTLGGSKLRSQVARLGEQSGSELNQMKTVYIQGERELAVPAGLLLPESVHIASKTQPNI